LDPGFIPLDWRSNPAPALRELALHHYIAINKVYERHRLTGLFSPKFFAKTGLRSGQVYDWITKNPGRDIYLIAGGPHVPYVYYNGVVLNQALHFPAFEERMRNVCRRIGFQLPDKFPRQTNSNRSSSSYWIGSRRFWESWFADVISPIFALISNARESDEIFAYATHWAPAPVYVLTFIYERLIDFYIGSKAINALYHPWNARSILSLDFSPSLKTYLQEMIPLVDRLDATGEWSDSDRAWLQKRSAALDETRQLASDPHDFDLPKRYPTRKDG
jgi:hypothetical protein